MATWAPAGPSPQQVPIDYGGFPPPGSPVTGRVSALAFGQFSGQPALYLGAAGGGLWRASNYSSSPTWTPLTDTQGTPVNAASGLGSGAIDVGSIAIDPGNGSRPQAIYVGTGEANYSADSHYGTGILKSTDGGNTWTLSTGPGDAFFGQSISKIIVDPTDPSGNTVFAAVVPAGGANPTAADQLYESKNGGTSWFALSNSYGQTSPVVITDIDFTVGASGYDLTLFVAVAYTSPAYSSPSVTGAAYGAAIYEVSFGSSGGFILTPIIAWKVDPDPVDPALSSVGRRIALAADHTPGASTIYAAAVQADGSFRNVYVTTNNGGAWDPAGASLPGNVTSDQGWFDLAR